MIFCRHFSLWPINTGFYVSTKVRRHLSTRRHESCKSTLTMNRLILPYPPSLNRAWRSGSHGVYKDSKITAYQRQAKLEAIAAGVCEPISGPIALWVDLHPRQPKKATGKPARCIDLDNSIKVAVDALNGIAWLDDRQVVELHARKGTPVPDGRLVVGWQLVTA